MTTGNLSPTYSFLLGMVLSMTACAESEASGQSTQGDLDASATAIAAELNDAINADEPADLERSVFVNEGDGYTVENAHVITETITALAPEIGREPETSRREYFVENFGERVGIIETNSSFRRSGRQLTENVVTLYTYIADGKKHFRAHRNEQRIDGEVIERGRWGEVETEDFDPIDDSTASTLMLTGIGGAPFGYTDGGAKSIAGVACKLWISKDRLGEECVWRGLLLYSRSRTEGNFSSSSETNTVLLEQGPVTFPASLTGLASGR